MSSDDFLQAKISSQSVNITENINPNVMQKIDFTAGKPMKIITTQNNNDILKESLLFSTQTSSSCSSSCSSECLAATTTTSTTTESDRSNEQLIREFCKVSILLFLSSSCLTYYLYLYSHYLNFTSISILYL
jgi:hypothetical protein